MSVLAQGRNVRGEALARESPIRRGWVSSGAAVLLMFAGLQVAFFLLLWAGQAVPDRPILDRLASAVRDGAYGPSYLPDRMGGEADSFTECIVVGTGLGAPPQESTLYRAVRMPRISSCEAGVGEILQLQAGGSVPKDSYYKYWAGYTAITRPVLALWGIEGLRILAGAVLLGGCMVMVVNVRSATSWPVALGLAAPLVLSTNVMSTPSLALSNALALGALFGGVGLIALAAQRTTRAALVATAMAAALYCYLDLLTHPPLAWALSAATVGLATWARTRQAPHTARATLGAAIVWIVAFGATWMSRWLIAAVFLGPSTVLAHVRSNVSFRVGGEWGAVQHGVGAGIGANVDWWLHRVSTAPATLAVGLLLAVAALAVALVRGGHERILVAALLCLPALLVVAWYMVLSNHSQIHAFLTYRALPGALGVIVAGCLAAASMAPVVEPGDEVANVTPRHPANVPDRRSRTRPSPSLK